MKNRKMNQQTNNAFSGASLQLVPEKERPRKSGSLFNSAVRATMNPQYGRDELRSNMNSKAKKR